VEESFQNPRMVIKRFLKSSKTVKVAKKIIVKIAG